MPRIEAKHSPWRASKVVDNVEITFTKVESLIWDIDIQFKDAHHENVQQSVMADVYIAPPTGEVDVYNLSSTIFVLPDGGDLIGLSGTEFDHGTLITGEFGHLKINIESQSSGKQFRIVVCLPDGSVAVSDVIDTNL